MINRYTLLIIIALVIPLGFFVFNSEGRQIVVDTQENNENIILQDENINDQDQEENALSYEDGDFDLPEGILGLPLSNPSEIIRAAYFTSWSASSESQINYMINLTKRTPLNAVVIDIKDYSGSISYNSELPSAIKYGANTNRIRDLSGLVKRLHDNEIYVIARITVFQDPILARSRPDLAVHSHSTGDLWLDNKGIAWIDPGAQEAWDYNISLAKDVLRHGVDEINFDYIRFPSDGVLSDIKYTHHDVDGLRRDTIRSFFEYMREELPDVTISADLFGLVTVNRDDLGIGQVLEHSYEFFDIVAPMVYPSHYAAGFLGLAQPAQHPYEVVYGSMKVARERLEIFTKEKYGIMDAPIVEMEEGGNSNEDLMVDGSDVYIEDDIKNLIDVRLIPWLQDFDLGANYDENMVRAQIQATKNALGDLYSGYYLWSPRNIYTEGGIIE